MKRQVPLDSDDLRVEAPPEDLEDDRIRAVLGARLFGRRESAKVDRFELGERLGSGGMGVVYRAKDPSLQRDVALKVVRPDRRARTQRASLLHEARFAARLQHPNVVTVYEVGEHDDAVWIAMELVDGETLRAWCESPRTWRELVEVFLDAGEGLAEAHRQGLVHRDFKPENVLVETLPDGRARPRVADFGVAQPMRVADDDDGTIDAIAGTPAYMAPEQLLGDAVDTRADQFAFCVSLYEALDGRRPFQSESSTEDATAPPHGDRAPLSQPRRSWPRWLFRVLSKGLEHEPARRFDSMEALLAQLRRGLARRRRRSMVLGGALAVGVAATAMLLGAPDPCRDARASMQQVWNTSTQEGLYAWIEPNDGGFRAESAGALTTGLDRWFERWGDARESACRASQVERRQSDTLQDLRDGCLDRALLEVDGWLRGVQAVPADPNRVSEAVAHLGRLPDLQACSDVTTLRRRVPLSGGASVRADATVIRDDVARLRGATYAGAWEPEEAQALLDRAKALGFAPLEADAALLLGLGELTHGRRTEARAHLGSGYHAAIRGRADRLAAEIALLRAWADIEVQDDLSSGARWLGDAKAYVEALGSPPELHSTWLDHAGVLASFEGRHADAEALHRESLALRLSIDAESLAVAGSRMNLFVALHRQKRYADARTQLGLAREIVVARLGPHHPQVGKFDTNLAAVLSLEGKPHEALQALDHALDVKTAAFGPGHPQLTTTLVNRSNARWELADHEGALRDLRDVIAIRVAEHGRVHASLLLPMSNLALSLVELERFEEGLAEALQTEAVASALHPDDHPDVVLAKHIGAMALAGLGRFVEADTIYTELEVATEGDESRACERADILHNHAEVKIAWGEDAEPLLLAAKALNERPDGTDCGLDL